MTGYEVGGTLKYAAIWEKKSGPRMGGAPRPELRPITKKRLTT